MYVPPLFVHAFVWEISVGQWSLSKLAARSCLKIKDMRVSLGHNLHPLFC